MKVIRIVIFIVLGIFSILMILTELKEGQDYVRHYFTDISGPVLFYGINTTMNTFILWAYSFVFVIVLSIQKISGKHLLFVLSQIGIFMYLGFDDRFKFHEIAGEIIGINDALIVGGVGVLEVVCLFWLGEVYKLKRDIYIFLIIAALFFFIMSVIDFAFPHEMTLRLTFEDLFKIWSSLFLLLFAWKYLLYTIEKKIETPHDTT